MNRHYTNQVAGSAIPSTKASVQCFYRLGGCMGDDFNVDAGAWGRVPRKVFQMGTALRSASSLLGAGSASPSSSAAPSSSFLMSSKSGRASFHRSGISSCVL